MVPQEPVVADPTYISHQYIDALAEFFLWGWRKDGGFDDVYVVFLIIHFRHFFPLPPSSRSSSHPTVHLPLTKRQEQELQPASSLPCPTQPHAVYDSMTP